MGKLSGSSSRYRVKIYRMKRSDRRGGIASFLSFDLQGRFMYVHKAPLFQGRFISSSSRFPNHCSLTCTCIVPIYIGFRRIFAFAWILRCSTAESLLMCSIMLYPTLWYCYLLFSSLFQLSQFLPYIFVAIKVSSCSANKCKWIFMPNSECVYVCINIYVRRNYCCRGKIKNRNACKDDNGLMLILGYGNIHSRCNPCYCALLKKVLSEIHVSSYLYSPPLTLLLSSAKVYIFFYFVSHKYEAYMSVLNITWKIIFWIFSRFYACNISSM